MWALVTHWAHVIAGDKTEREAGRPVEQAKNSFELHNLGRIVTFSLTQPAHHNSPVMFKHFGMTPTISPRSRELDAIRHIINTTGDTLVKVMCRTRDQLNS